MGPAVPPPDSDARQLAADDAGAFRDEDTAFRPDPQDFPPLPPAQPGDWLARFDEPKITFEQYVSLGPVRPTAERGTIVLQPLGAFPEDRWALVKRLGEFTRLFFGVPVTVATPMQLPSRGLRVRREGKTWKQYLTTALLDRVLAPNLPKEALCYLGITLEDLYPEESWNYVFGQASLDNRVGVYSLARYFASFWGSKDSAASIRQARLRSFKVLAHETGHMFTVGHCTWHPCVMNGSNSLEEMDHRPERLCAVCLKKLAWNLGFDVRARYRSLQQFYQQEGLVEQGAWIGRRLARIG